MTDINGFLNGNFSTVKSALVVVSTICGLTVMLWGCAIAPIRSDIDRLIVDQRSNMREVKEENRAAIEDLKKQVNDRLTDINRMFDRGKR